ncbi:MAG: alginate lyase family protein, partial [Blastocatellia bacterium]
HIETHLSTYFSPNTHLTGEALGLFYLGLSFPELRRAAMWKETGLAVLLDQMSRQVRTDGVYFEQSSYYHRYSVDFYLSLLQLARENQIELPADVKRCLEAMVEYLMWTTRPDGLATLIGDDDGGKLLALGGSDTDDFRDSIAWAAALFGRPSWKYAAGDRNPELLWLLGPDGLKMFDDLPAAKPDQYQRSFSATGQFVARDGWESDSTYLFFRCGPRGALSGAHDHADQLSFELCANGTAWLVDPGTYTYTSDDATRNEFRLTQAHNTLTVDDISQSVPLGPFSWSARAYGLPDTPVSNHRFVCVGGSHDGYEGNLYSVGHRRTVITLARDERTDPVTPAYFLVIDYLE